MYANWLDKLDSDENSSTENRIHGIPDEPTVAMFSLVSVFLIVFNTDLPSHSICHEWQSRWQDP